VSMSKRRRRRSGRFSGAAVGRLVTVSHFEVGLGVRETRSRIRGEGGKEVTAGAGAADSEGVGTDGEGGKAAGQEGFGEGSVSRGRPGTIRQGLEGLDEGSGEESVGAGLSEDAADIGCLLTISLTDPDFTTDTGKVSVFRPDRPHTPPRGRALCSSLSKKLGSCRSYQTKEPSDALPLPAMIGPATCASCRT
jgi:hypothetical protein